MSAATVTALAAELGVPVEAVHAEVMRLVLRFGTGEVVAVHTDGVYTIRRTAQGVDLAQPQPWGDVELVDESAAYVRRRLTAHTPAPAVRLRYPGGKDGMWEARCVQAACDYVTSPYGTEVKANNTIAVHAAAANDARAVRVARDAPPAEPAPAR